MTKSCNHTTIQKGHPRSLTNLKDFHSNRLSLSLVPRPTKRYFKKQALKYLYCPDCESKNIIYHGKSSKGTQKHKCKSCGYQFVAQFDSYFPRSTRRFIFEEEYLANLQRQGFKEGVGRQEYWEGAIMATLNMVESQQMLVRINKMLKSTTVQSENDYRLLVQFIVHEAYVRANR